MGNSHRQGSGFAGSWPGNNQHGPSRVLHCKALPLIYHKVGQRADNLGITALDARANPEDATQRAIYASVANFSSNTMSADLDFGQPPTAEAIGVPVRVLGKPIAILVAERAAEEEPWTPVLFSLLVNVAQLRLDLDLVRRKLKMAAGTPVIVEEAAEPEADTVDEEPPSQAPEVSEHAAEAGARPSEPQAEPVAEGAEMDAARRYAKLLATDIRLYNEEAVMLGRRHGDLVERLGEHLDRGKTTFLRRHGELGPAALEILHEAYLQVLAGGDAGLMPSDVLD